MIQSDYLLKEIEKIGTILSAIRQKLFSGSDNLAITLERDIENAKGQLLNAVNFDLDVFLSLDTEKSNEYISNFEGFSNENIECLADCLLEIGFSEKCENPKEYLEKALCLYQLCNLKSKTFSMEQEAKIRTIKALLSND